MLFCFLNLILKCRFFIVSFFLNIFMINCFFSIKIKFLVFVLSYCFLNYMIFFVFFKFNYYNLIFLWSNTLNVWNFSFALILCPPLPVTRCALQHVVCDAQISSSDYRRFGPRPHVQPNGFLGFLCVYLLQKNWQCWLKKNNNSTWPKKQYRKPNNHKKCHKNKN